MSQSRRREAERPTILLGTAAAVAAMAIWIALTARTGTTYHLFPFVIAAAVGTISRLSGQPPLSRNEAVVTTAAGLLAVALGWLALIALDETPSATVFDGQPGGVPGEVVIVAAVGAAVGLWWAVRGSARRRAR